MLQHWSKNASYIAQTKQKLRVIKKKQKKLAEQNTYFDQQFRYLETVTTSVITNHRFFNIFAKQKPV